MNGWIPTEPVKPTDSHELVFREGDFLIGIDRNVPLARWSFGAAQPRGFLQKLRDAWFGMVNGFRYGRSDE